MATAAAGSGSNDSDWEVLRDLSNKIHVPVGALEIFFILLFSIICGWTVFVVGREVRRVLAEWRAARKLARVRPVDDAELAAAIEMP